jgi:lysophospholipase L1-like esterase
MPRRSLITAAATALAILLAAAPTAAGATTVSQPLATCEHGLEHARTHGAHTLAVVGASFTAGVGPGVAGGSWAVLLAHMLHWDAVVDGVPGAGYVRAGLGGQGPVAAELTRIGLRALAPALVIIQAGHDDIGVPARAEQQRVRQAVALIRTQAPQARIGLITVFTTQRSRFARPYAPAAAYRTDDAIVAAATAADHNVIIMDPLAGRWAFARSHDRLHPTVAGSAWIARQVAAILRGHGIAAAAGAAGSAGSAAAAGAAGSAGAATPVVCDSGVSSPRRPPAVPVAIRARPRHESPA